ncbi:hypothetical protein M409DRAFT_56436 [Zasmidium cellare ATCC 36951]|uniref:Cytochrome P450 n=1 Tax=Zasmidium cellare ATCC 36951 TaxID=1080233 RepID=A0A6A6CGQ8_ZASCE|nr:uncharacterized protein M409DRAFT_56436 [Zasmidium cellare ATCC 36951]KAF2164606.1 hypothetical protein M409DRAFT_56436 [Zasmidium cellare ATCC 36951]
MCPLLYESVVLDAVLYMKAPKSLPIIGYTARLLQPRYKLLDYLARLQSSRGVKTFEIPSPFVPPTVLINDPACLEYVFREHELFAKGSFFRSRMHDLFGDGILNASGPLWQSQRKAGVNFLSSANVTRFSSETLPPLMEAMHERLTTAAIIHEMVDLQELLLDLMSKFFGLVAYDTVPGADQVRAFDEASAWTDARFTNPLWQFYELFFGQPLQRALEIVKKFGHEVVIKAAEKTRTPGHQSLLDLLLARLPDKETVADAATTFMSAGRDTTAQAMTWTVYELSKSPKVLSTLLTSLEPHSITRDSSTRSPLRTIGLHPRYIKAVFAEALRLNPSVPLNMRETARRCRLPDGTVLQAGTIVAWASYAMARSSAIWGEDAQDFRPERWLSSDENGNSTFVPRSASEYPVFHGGSRVCIGKSMAEAVGCQVLAELVLNWEFELVDKETRKHAGESLTAPMDGGLLVRPRRRVWTDTKA